MRVAIFGRGKVGSALHARASESAGLESTLRPARQRAPRGEADLVVLAVPDGAIAETARRLDDFHSPSVPFVHCAGTAPAEIPLPSDRPTGAMHPIVSFARPRETQVAGRAFSLRGAARAIQGGEAFAVALGAIPLTITAAGPAYHAASAITANGAVALAHVSVRILESIGLNSEDASLAMVGLLRSVADNVEAMGVPAALTGPIARGDASVVEAHRSSLEPDDRAAYEAISKLILRVARERGLEEGAASTIAALLERG